MKVLLVEDDGLQAEFVAAQFKKNFKETEVRRISSESQFLNEFSELETWVPDLIILDVMIRWCNPSAQMPQVPNEIKDGGFHQAGFRCLEIISNSETLFNVPVIMHSVLASTDIQSRLLTDLPPHVFILGKEEDADNLLRLAKSVVNNPPEENRPSSSILSKLARSAELKPGWLGLRIDLKSLFGRGDKK